MAYLGNVPARSFISFERQVFTIVNSQTAYTLSHSVTNENDIRLVVNNVVQEPGSGKAYTATGTTLTLSAALTNGTDEMYCVFLGRATATNAPGAASVGTSQLAADAVTNAKIADDAISDEQLDPTVITGQTAETSIATDDLILLSDTSASGALKKMTRANFVSGVGETNTPFFLAYQAGGQALSNNTATKVQATKVFESSTDIYSNTNYRFTVPSGQGGTYWVTINGQGYDVHTNGQNVTWQVYKNGSAAGNQYYAEHYNIAAFRNQYLTYTGLIQLAAADYIEAYGTVNVTGTTGALGLGYTKFSAFKVSS